MANNYKTNPDENEFDDEDLCTMRADIKSAFEDKSNDDEPKNLTDATVDTDKQKPLVEDKKQDEEIRNLLAEKKLIGEKYLLGLHLNVIRYLFIPCFLAFVLFKNISALYASGFEIVSLINVVSVLFFSSVAAYLSFDFLKAQIASQASSDNKRKNIVGASIKQIILENGTEESPWILKRQGLALEFFLGLVLPTVLFILIFCVMNTLDIFAIKIAYIVLAFIFVLALMNDPINSARSKPCCKIARFL
ncbi:hypothetical protein [Pseudomonas ficuserectae]|uniref:hypothetical protein n=1 Tax=Pseudomonas ficuserectae TaxID=53410 RepID=UPI000F008083|nr:hypothetical protein [Pseudomonas ficuserectae]